MGWDRQLGLGVKGMTVMGPNMATCASPTSSLTPGKKVLKCTLTKAQSLHGNPLKRAYCQGVSAKETSANKDTGCYRAA